MLVLSHREDMIPVELVHKGDRIKVTIVTMYILLTCDLTSCTVNCMHHSTVEPQLCGPGFSVAINQTMEMTALLEY